MANNDRDADSSLQDSETRNDRSADGGAEQHVLVPLAVYQGGVTKYRCVKCGGTGMGGITGTCRGER